jgi:hypothetical protein
MTDLSGQSDRGDESDRAEGETHPGEAADYARHATSFVSVVQRDDYAVTDEGAVIAAGRAAYLRTWPDQTTEDAESRVPGLAEALYEIAHADGWAALDDTVGIHPMGSAINVSAPDAPIDLSGSSADETELLHEDYIRVEGETIYSEINRYF